jgi:hypothetical protein
VDGAGRAHVRLPTLPYFLFWLAFYVLRSGQAAAEPARARGGRYLAPSLGAVKKARAARPARAAGLPVSVLPACPRCAPQRRGACMRQGFWASPLLQSGSAAGRHDCPTDTLPWPAGRGTCAQWTARPAAAHQRRWEPGQPAPCPP